LLEKETATVFKMNGPSICLMLKCEFVLF